PLLIVDDLVLRAGHCTQADRGGRTEQARAVAAVADRGALLNLIEARRQAAHRRHWGPRCILIGDPLLPPRLTARVPRVGGWFLANTIHGFLPFGALARVVVGDGAALALYRSRAFAIGKSLLARWAALAATNGAARRTTLDAVAIPVLTKAATGSPDQVSGI